MRISKVHFSDLRKRHDRVPPRRGLGRGAARRTWLATGESNFVTTVRSWYRKRRRLAALSHGERWRNRTLWGLLVLALVYAVAQHVVLIEKPELFRWGAELGELFYSLAVGYVGAFLFYLLNIRLPLRRDRRNIYPHIGPMIGMIVRHTNDFVRICDLAAKVDPPSRPNTWENIEDLCSKIGPNDEVPALVPIEMRQLVDNTVAGMISDRLARTRANVENILKFSSFLATDLVDLLTEIETHSYSINFDSPIKGPAVAVVERANGDRTELPIPARVANKDLSVWAERIFQYLILVDLLDKYGKTYLGDGVEYMEHKKRTELADAFRRTAKEAPLSDFIDRAKKMM